MGYGRYNSSSYSSYGSGGGSYSSSSYGGFSTRGSSMRSTAYVPQTSTSRSFSSHSNDTSTASQATTNKVTSQQAAEQQAVSQKNTEQKSSTQKNQKVAAPAAQKNKSADQKAAQSSSQKSSSQKSSENVKKTSKQKSSTQKTDAKTDVKTDVSNQKTASTQQTTEKTTSEEKVSEQKTVQKTSEAQAVVEEKEESVAIVFTEGSFQAENMAAAKNAKAQEVEKTADELKLEKEQLRKETKQKDLQDMELQVTKHPKFLALQEKLNARITANKKNKAGKAAPESKIKPPTGHITYGLITIKNTASFLELSLSNEDTTLKTLEDIHDLLDKEFVAHNIYKVEAEIGKFLLVSKNLDDMLNLAMKVQIKFNEHQWDDMIINLPMFRKLLRPEDLLNDDAVALFNGPRISIGIHTGEAKYEEDKSGKERFGGESILQVETIGKFAQGGQILVSSSAWSRINQSKLSTHIINRLGVFKLENFSSGCSVVEVVPEILQERTKFYGSICSHCAKGIQPWEKSLQKLDCTFHEDHFKCFNCDENVSEGAFAAYQGLPHCHKCYLASNPKPKCKKCTNTISKDYINALGAYWHSKCFSCRQCSKRASASNPLFGYKDAPYCQPCHKKLSSM